MKTLATVAVLFGIAIWFLLRSRRHRRMREEHMRETLQRRTIEDWTRLIG